MSIIGKTIVFILLFHPFIKMEAQNYDYFEFQIKDPSAIHLTDQQLGKFYGKTWYLVYVVDNKVPTKIDTARWSNHPVKFDWDGKMDKSTEFRLIDNKFILIKNKKRHTIDLNGLFSITQFNDSSLILVANYRSDYKWKVTYFFTDYKGSLKTKGEYDNELKIEQAFTKREDSIRKQKNAVWVRLAEVRKDSLRKVEEDSMRRNIAQKYKPGKTIEYDTILSKDGQIRKTTIKIVIVENGLGDVYLMQNDRTWGANFLMNGGKIPPEKFWEAYQKE